jgi:hypothetical protein
MTGLVITTAQRSGTDTARRAAELAKRLDVPFIERKKEPLDILSRGWQDNVLVVTAKGMQLETAEGSLAFHPGLSKLRIRNLMRGEGDALVSALGIGMGSTVLDCTLGPGADAIVAACAAGPAGRVVGLESVPVLAVMMQEGLASYRDEDPCLNEAMGRVEVICQDHREYLAALPDNSFDVVYFDPMFRRPLQRSSSMEPLRGLANPAPLSPDAVREAVRVAARRVVMKETRNSGEFVRLGFTRTAGGRYSPVAYGIIDKGEVDP